MIAKNKSKSKKRYWYVKEIELCVMCGREKIRKFRVYKKPKHKVSTLEFACGEHFF